MAVTAVAAIAVAAVPERKHANLAVFNDGFADDALDGLEVAHVVRVHDTARHLCTRIIE